MKDEFSFNPLTDHWDHPIQMIMAADEIKPADTLNNVVYCRHLLVPSPMPGSTLDISIKETMEAVPIVLTWYIMGAWHEKIGWSILVQMGLCSCGILYINRTNQMTIERRDAYGTGKHSFKYVEEKWNGFQFHRNR